MSSRTFSDAMTMWQCRLHPASDPGPSPAREAGTGAASLSFPGTPVGICWRREADELDQDRLPDRGFAGGAIRAIEAQGG